MFCLFFHFEEGTYKAKEEFVKVVVVFVIEFFCCFCNGCFRFLTCILTILCCLTLSLCRKMFVRKALKK